MFRLDQKGISLPLVLAILAIVVANTFYFMNTDEETKKTNIKRSAEVDDNSEKVRLISFLSDSTTCSRYFAGKNVPFTDNTPLTKKTIDYSIPSPITYKYVNFLAPGTLYARNSLQFLSYKISLTKPDEVLLPAGPPLEKRYSLYVTYTIMDRKPSVPVATLKTRQIRLPLTLAFANPPVTYAGTPQNAVNAIKSCYADPTNDSDTISTVVTLSCLGDGAVEVPGNPSECQFNMPPAVCTDGKVFTGVTNGPNGSFAFSCARPINAGGSTGTQQCATTPLKTLLYEITGVDQFNCRSGDAVVACAQGELLVMGIGGVHTCAKPCSSITLFQKMNSDGTSSCLAKPQTCPNTQYARTIYSNGSVDCADYPILGKSCPAGQFATDLDPTKSGAGALKCAALNKERECPSPSDFTFVQSFASTTISCTTY